MTGALVVISYQHADVHQGSSYKSDVIDGSLSDSETIILAFKTAAGTKRAHLIAEFSTLVGGNLEIWEGVTWTAETGSLNPILNRWRQSSMNSSMMLENSGQPTFTATDNLILNPTGLSTGTAISVHHLYAWGKKEKFAGGSVRDIEELILKPDTQYAVVFTASGGSNAAQIILNWYEHTDN
jgi:hypothetical protein